MKNKLKKLAAGICILSIFVIFYIYAENAFRVNAQGNVGIGTENPTTKLEVNGRIKDKTGYIMPVGTILPFAGPLDNVPAGWLACDGQSYPIDQNNEYWELYTAIGISWGGDANDFNVPDLRGLFLRGTDDMGTDAGAAGRDPEVDRNVGSHQEDAFQGHEHQFYFSEAGSSGGHVAQFAWAHNDTTGYRPTNAILLKDSYGTPRYSTETRPKNVCVNYIIKY